ncbi:Ceramidase [Aliiroseovarius halocynthiae]|uniref:Ceramidase n=1 Tax=Aliiroseovarius halocynthiae TaxID=985055 RepID=A0A545SVB0_9RHOB|nr:ceramidase domain-containing protein [Aliiroseovarius halocynthiae]TQV68910.1 ceramidase [Aliiroseovarius halocynthiae]SMR71488.1 Ceramidase [Aliiroseovarius halocynthiae]
MDWFTPIDIYCERVGTAFWAEPLNAISNISFILAAVWGWIEAKRRDRLDLMTGILILLAAMIGVGSFLFHTLANAWAELADVIPIWTFVALFVLVALRRIAGIKPGALGIGVAIAATLIAVLIAFGGDGADNQSEHPPATSDEIATPLIHDHDHGHAAEKSLLNGSEQYLPAVLALLVFTFMTRRSGHQIASWVTAATITFMISLTFRTLDMHICEIWPTGTHFIWHILNGVMIALLFQGLIRSPDLRQTP